MPAIEPILWIEDEPKDTGNVKLGSKLRKAGFHFCPAYGSNHDSLSLWAGVRYLLEALAGVGGRPVPSIVLLDHQLDEDADGLGPAHTAAALELCQGRPKLSELVKKCFETPKLLIPMKVIIDSDLIPVTGSEVKLIVFGAKRRWRSYPA